jgi:hypothetical protein
MNSKKNYLERGPNFPPKTSAIHHSCYITSVLAAAIK